MTTPTVREADLLPISLVSDECGGPVEVRAEFEKFAGRDLEWVLQDSPSTGTGASGRLAWIADEGFYDDLSFSPDPGRYRITVTLVAEARVVVDAEFEILGCVTAAAGCHSVTFSNPQGGPAVRVRYGPAQGEDWPDQDSGNDGEAILQPGETRAIPILYYEIYWKAMAAATERGVPKSGAGEHYSELPDQHCGPTMTRGTVRCASARRGTVDAWLSPPSERGVRYRIVDDMSGKPIDRGGRVGKDGRVHGELPVGGYVFRSYTDDEVLPYDQAWFQVERCVVTAVPKCRAARFTNPTGYDVEIRYRSEDSADSSGTTRIGAGKTKTVPMASGKLSWRAYVDEADALWQVEAGRGSVRIDPDCS